MGAWPLPGGAQHVKLRKTPTRRATGPSVKTHRCRGTQHQVPLELQDPSMQHLHSILYRGSMAKGEPEEGAQPAQMLSSSRHWRRELSVLPAQSATPGILSPTPCTSLWPNRGRSGVMEGHFLTANGSAIKHHEEIDRLLSAVYFP
ncbi:hypothetical protein QTO34_016827 [Cnephaeus nilssonii]|uniref:Uncharacterized protein n=1 Tax=Cnephaeus nilssonii TaxID=3371016 RepID=A0AA40LSI7_CNENI|nr:hypothetical protein QTO34_016827 [Eptesicus nilssonii]